MKYSFSAILLLLCLSSTLQAQFFKGGIVLGGNFTQIDGDAVAGYSKLGINAGAISEVVLSDKFRLGFEILYSQKGSRSTPRNLPNSSFRILLDYTEIPVMVRYYDQVKGIDNAQFVFGAGLSLGRLVRTKYIENGIDLTDGFILADKPKQTGLSGVAEVGYMFNDFLGLTIRTSYSFIPIRADPISRYPNFAQYNNVVTARLIFLFSSLLESR